MGAFPLRGPAPFFLQQERWRRYSYNHFIAQRMSLGGQETRMDLELIQACLTPQALFQDASPFGVSVTESQLRARASGPKWSVGAKVQPGRQWWNASAKRKNIFPTYIMRVRCGLRRETTWCMLMCHVGCFWESDPFLMILAMTCFGKECSRIIFFHDPPEYFPWSHSKVPCLQFDFHTVSPPSLNIYSKQIPFKNSSVSAVYVITQKAGDGIHSFPSLSFSTILGKSSWA